MKKIFFGKALRVAVRSLILLVLAILASSDSHAGIIVQNESNGAYGLTINSVGQSFTAEDARIQSIGVYIEASTPATGTISCALYLGENVGSLITNITVSFSTRIVGYVEFDTSSVTLQVGQKYFFLISQGPGADALVFSNDNHQSDRYAGGRAYHHGAFYDNQDLRFYVAPADQNVSFIGFAVSALTVSETDANALITVKRSGATSTTASVNYATSVPGFSAAMAGVHFASTSGTLQFAANETEKLIQVPIFNDESFLTNKVFNVQLSVPAGSPIVLIQSSIMVSIADDDAVFLNASSVNFSVSESAGTLSIPIYRTGKTNNAAGLHYQLYSQTATEGADYVAAAGDLIFGPGETNKVVQISVLSDHLVEGDEYVGLQLTPKTTETITNPYVSILIRDSTTYAEFPFASTNVTESQGTIKVPVNRRGVTDQAITVSYETQAGTASSGTDFLPASGQLTFNPGESLKYIDVTVVQDTAAEDTEGFTVKLTGAADLLGPQTTLQINVSNVASVVSVASTNVTVLENAGTVQIPLLRTGLTNVECTVFYLTVAGTASAGSDYVAKSGQVTFAPGATNAFVDVTIMDDDLAEGSEWFMLIVSPSDSNTVIAQDHSTINIQDNASTVQFATASQSVLEGAGQALVEVRRTSELTRAATVSYTTLDGTAHAGTDYGAASGTITFAPGETSKLISVPIFDDLIANDDRAFQVKLQNPVGEVVIGNQSSDTITIGNDEQKVALSEARVIVPLGTPGARIKVKRGPGSLAPVSVQYATADGTAVQGIDYTATQGTLEFVSGNATAEAEIPILDPKNSSHLGKEFKVILSTPAGATLDVPSEAIVQFTASIDFNYDFNFESKVRGQIGGSFVGLQPNTNGKIVYNDGNGNLIRLNPDGSFDSTFHPAFQVRYAAFQSDGSIVFISNSSSNPQLGRMGPDGTSDTGFAGAAATNLSVDRQDRIYVGMYVNSVTQLRRFSANGIPDDSFSIGVNSSHGNLELVFDADGRIFLNNSGYAITRYSANGEFEKQLAPVNTVSLRAGPGNKLYYSQMYPFELRRIDLDLNPDPSWTIPKVSGVFLALADGEVFVSNGSIYYTGLPVLLESDGSISPYLKMLRGVAPISAGVMSAIEDAAGNILLSGIFSSLDLDPIPGFVRYTRSPSSMVQFKQSVFGAYSDETNVKALVDRIGTPGAPSQARVASENGSLAGGVNFTPVNSTITFDPMDMRETIDSPLLSPVAGNFYLNLSDVVGSVSGQRTRAEVQVVALPPGEFVRDLNFAPAIQRTGFSPAAAFTVQTGKGILAKTSVSGFGGDTVVRYTFDGSFDPSFTPIRVGGSNAVSGITWAGGRIYLTTYFYFGNGLWRFFENGDPDPTILAAGSITPNAPVLVQPDGKVISQNSTRATVARVNADGGSDLTFHPPALNWTSGAQAFALQSDGKILVGGDSLVRLNSDGVIDSAFADAHPNKNISTLALQTDGKLLAGGGFSLIAGHSAPGLARLNIDGTFDTSFQPDIASFQWIYSLQVFNDGKIVVGGDFPGYLRRLTSTGAVDPSFASISLNGAVTHVQSQDIDNILVGGYFTSPNAGLLRLTTRQNHSPALALNVMEGGKLSLKLSAAGGAKYSLLESTNLTDWLPSLTTNLPADQFELSITNSAANRFFKGQIDQ